MTTAPAPYSSICTIFAVCSDRVLADTTIGEFRANPIYLVCMFIYAILCQWYEVAGFLVASSS